MAHPARGQNGLSAEILVLSLDHDGQESVRLSLGQKASGITFGSNGFIAAGDKTIVVALNNGSRTQLDFKRKNIVRLPSVCWSGDATRILEIEASSGRIIQEQTIPQFRTSTIVRAGGRILIGGERLNDCAMKGAAEIVQYVDGEVLTFWRDEDVFSSKVRGMVPTRTSVRVVVNRERMLSFSSSEKSSRSAPESKRWGDNYSVRREATLSEFSEQGQLINERYLSPGLSVTLTGVASVQDRFVTYGSLGGMPAWLIE